MKRNPCALTLLAALLAVLVLPSTARAAEVSHFRGKTAYADFYSVDATGCIFTSVSVFATESRFQNPPGGPTSSAWADVSIYQWNECTYEQGICGYASFPLPDGAFNMSGNLASASLNATAETYDYCSGTSQPVGVALAWTGDGQIFRGNSVTSYHYPSYRASYRSNGQSCNATVSGSVSFGSTTVQLANGYASLSSVNSGSIYNFH
jgi:hypothetical protein